MATLTSDQLVRIYDDVLDPTFPDDELVTRDDFVDRVTSGAYEVFTLGDPDEPEAVAVGHLHRPSGVFLFEWLAVRPGIRGRGTGRRAVSEALDHWQQALSPRMVIGEVEHPWLVPADETHGDPSARLRFYHSFGAKVVDVRYAQPPLREGGAVVPHLMVTVFRVDGEAPGDEVPARPLRQYLEFRFPHAEEPYAAALADADVELLPTTELDADHGLLPNAPRLDA